MARKSRKNMMPQAAVQEAVQQNEKELLRTAAYARLSVENGGHETEDSLHTQILQIHNYITTIIPPSFAYMELTPAVSRMITSFTCMRSRSASLTICALSGQLQ